MLDPEILSDDVLPIYRIRMHQPTYSLILSVMFTILADFGSLLASKVVRCFGRFERRTRVFTTSLPDHESSQT
jgi:hypothetical protein